jgi:isopenicillin N synthase-like dioxygenase
VGLQENLDWAELITIDLSHYGTPEGKKKLAEQLIYALREKGFFYVKNFNISQERVDRQFALGREFYELPVEEKSKYTPEGLGMSFDIGCNVIWTELLHADQGKFNGYVPAGRYMWVYLP